MALTAVVNIKVDENVKRDVEKLYESLGMNISTAVNMFFKQCLIDRAVPFQPRLGRRHLTTEERLKDYHGDYTVTEWDTGETQTKDLRSNQS